MTNYDEEVDDYSAEFEPEPDSEESLPSADEIDTRHELAVRILEQIHENIGNVIRLLERGDLEDGRKKLAELVTSKREINAALEGGEGAKVVEGVFDGQNMIGSDGKTYTVPPNYASKSRLVEGDILKLVIKEDGAFVFKQIGPIERKREVGRLAMDSATGSFVAMGEDNTWKVLTASVTFFKGEPGDEAVVLVPKSAPSTWAAIENVVKR